MNNVKELYVKNGHNNIVILFINKNEFIKRRLK